MTETMTETIMQQHGFEGLPEVAAPSGLIGQLHSLRRSSISGQWGSE
jgi:hypothetical protein